MILISCKFNKNNGKYELSSIEAFYIRCCLKGAGENTPRKKEKRRLLQG